MLLIIILCLIGHVMLTYLCYYNGKSYYDNRVKNNKIRPKVFDILHKYLPDYSHSKTYHILLNILTLLPLLFNLSIFNELIIFFIPILILRHITTNMTVLPKDKSCDDKLSFDIFLNGHCYDKVFSGHLTLSILISLLLYKNNLVTNTSLLLIYNIVIAYLLIITRSHYSIDLILSLYVTITAYLLNINLSTIMNLLASPKL